MKYEFTEDVVETLPVCQQPKRTGRCRGYFKKFFYNKDSRQCEQFIYGGCDGNDNNFETQVECERRCRTGGTLTSKLWYNTLYVLVTFK